MGGRKRGRWGQDWRSIFGAPPRRPAWSSCLSILVLPHEDFRVKPEELLYSKTHEWAGVVAEGGAKTATVGISKFAVEQLTDLVFIQLPKVGDHVSAGKEFGEVESVKAV